MRRNMGMWAQISIELPILSMYGTENGLRASVLLAWVAFRRKILHISSEFV
jgi:hypothetical protein